MKWQNIVLAGTLLAALAVALGAFGAHALNDLLIQSGRLDTYQTAVQYQMYHSIGLIFAGLILSKYNLKLINYASLFFFLGILFFSIFLIILCLTNNSTFAIFAPVGGLSYIVGWVLMGVGIYKTINKQK